MAKKLQDTNCGTLPAGVYPDGVVQGLRLRVGARTRTFEMRIRRNGVRVPYTLGHYPALSLGEARSKATDLVNEADKGTPVDKLATVLMPTDEKTLGERLVEYETRRRQKGKRIKSLDETMRMLRAYLVDDLNKPFSQFTKTRIRAIRDAIAEGRHPASRKKAPIASNRFLGSLSPFMTWVASEEIEGIEYNPVKGMDRRGGVNERERVLTDDEMRAVWAACEGAAEGNDVAAAYGRLVQFLLATGQRKGEGASILHGHVLDGIWKQFGNKSDRTHWLKLTATALTALGQGEARTYAFEGKMQGQPINGFSKLHVALVKRAGTAWWTLHDLRRTVSTRLEAMKVDDKYIHALLNHGKKGLKKNYFHDELFEPKAETLATWDGELRRILRRAPALRVVTAGS